MTNCDNTNAECYSDSEPQKTQHAGRLEVHGWVLGFINYYYLHEITLLKQLQPFLQIHHSPQNVKSTHSSLLPSHTSQHRNTVIFPNSARTPIVEGGPASASYLHHQLLAHFCFHLHIIPFLSVLVPNGCLDTITHPENSIFISRQLANPYPRPAQTKHSGVLLSTTLDRLHPRHPSAPNPLLHHGPAS